MSRQHETVRHEQVAPANVPTAIDDIEALATELETAASEHRAAAEDAETRARQLREAAATLKPAESPFTTTVSEPA